MSISTTSIYKTVFKKSFYFIAALSLVVSSLALVGSETVRAFPKGMAFPVVGGGWFTDTYYAPRARPAVHRAADIFAPKHTPVVSAVDGVVEHVGVPEPSYGYSIEIRDAEGFLYIYLHMNNDSIGTDDGNGGPMNAYAPDIPKGAKVKKGQLIGYLGDSGNAETTPPHLHFEILDSKGTHRWSYDTSDRVNPYPYLLEAPVLSSPVKDYPPVVSGEILPYGTRINAHPSIAVGRFIKGSSDSQIAVGTGPGYAPHVRVIDKTGKELAGFYAYNPNQFKAGVDVAAADVDGDGVDEIITGTLSGAPHVRALKLDGKEVVGFYAYKPEFTGGVNVAGIDMDGDKKAEIITGPGSGGGPHVRAFSPTGKNILNFHAYNQKYLGGVDVSAGDVTGDAKPEIVTTPGPGGSAHLRMFTASGAAIGNGFNAYEAYTGYTGGARVSVGNIRIEKTNLNDKAEILVGPKLMGGPHFRLLKADGKEVAGGYLYEHWWSGNYDVAAGEGVSYVSSGTNRRSSIRPGLGMPSPQVPRQ